MRSVWRSRFEKFGQQHSFAHQSVTPSNSQEVRLDIRGRAVHMSDAQLERHLRTVVILTCRE